MRNRDEFIATACAMAITPHANEATRRDHVAAVKATAEAMADALGLPVDDAPYPWRAANPAMSNGELAAAQARIAELEKELEAATAPKPGRRA